MLLISGQSGLPTLWLGFGQCAWQLWLLKVFSWMGILVWKRSFLCKPGPRLAGLGGSYQVLQLMSFITIVMFCTSLQGGPSMVRAAW